MKIVADTFEPIDLRDVKVRGLVGERIEITWKKNLLVLNVDEDFLRPFLDKKAEKGGGFIGLGNLMTALVGFAYHTGDTSLLSIKKHVFGKIIENQMSDGYIGMFSPENRISRLWDVHEISYIIVGLVLDYIYFNEQKSLEAAREAADYLIENLPGKLYDLLYVTGENLSLELSTCGLEEALLVLYEVTGDKRYLDFCNKELNLFNWNMEIVIGRHPRVLGHVYPFISRCIGQLELYHIYKDESLLSQTRRVIDFLRKKGGLLITGSCGKKECWHADQSGEGGPETCATAILIRLLDALLRLEGEAIYGDMMERAIYNALFAAQSPDGRKLRYYTPFEGKRQYFERDIYCCPNNFRRIISELPGMIYYKSRGGLAVNLYTSSSLTTEIIPGVSLEVNQETDYPNSGKVLIHLNPSETATFPVRLRMPGWCGKFAVKVNNEPISSPRDHGFLLIDREWKASDTVTLEMEMDWRLIKGFNRQHSRVAVMRGPIVFCLNPTLNEVLTGKDLRALTIIPSTLQLPMTDHTLRPNGITCRVRAYSQLEVHSKPEPPFVSYMDLILTEFPDPGGETSYFLTPDMKDAVDDELLGP